MPKLMLMPKLATILLLSCKPAIPLEPFFPTDPNKVPTVNPDKPLW